MKNYLLLLILFVVGFGSGVLADKLSQTNKVSVAAGDYLSIFGSGTNSEQNINWSILQENMYVDAALYTMTAGTGGVKSLYITADGKIYAN